MASGKSLELAKIAPHPSAKCTCGEPYDEHLRKDGKGLLKKFDDGKTPIDFPLFDATLATIRQRLAAATMPGHSRVDEAAEMLGAMTHAETLADFLTLAAYERID